VKEGNEARFLVLYIYASLPANLYTTYAFTWRMEEKQICSVSIYEEKLVQ
jgi:hypothetical protein